MPRTYDEAEDRIEELELALHRIREWCDAYPIDIFTPPTEGEVKASVDAMKATNCASSEQMHSSWARHILGGVKGYTDVLNNSSETKEPK